MRGGGGRGGHANRSHLGSSARKPCGERVCSRSNLASFKPGREAGLFGVSLRTWSVNFRSDDPGMALMIVPVLEGAAMREIDLRVTGELGFHRVMECVGTRTVLRFKRGLSGKFDKFSWGGVSPSP